MPHTTSGGNPANDAAGASAPAPPASQSPRVCVRGRTTNAEWQAIDREILERLDIREEYEALGVRFLSRSKRSGWLECYAIDRTDEKSPGSAAVCVSGPQRGMYNDLAHNRLKLGLFNFAAQYGNFATWQVARRHYAAKVGVALPGDDAYRKTPLQAKQTRRPKQESQREEKKCEDIGADLAAYYHAALVPEPIDPIDDPTGPTVTPIDRIAESLHVHRDALIAMGVGYVCPGTKSPYAIDRNGSCSLWPECRFVEYNRVTAVSADRRGDGIKRALARRVRGITVPHDWAHLARATGYLFIVEGGSDVAALTSLGLSALGIPSAGGLPDQIAALIGRAMQKGSIPDDIRIICMIDRDGGAGATGMAKVARELANTLRRPIYSRYAPDVDREDLAPLANDDDRMKRYREAEYGFAKDSREWLGWRLARPDQEPEEVRHALGREFVRRTFMRNTEPSTRYCEWNDGVTHPDNSGVCSITVADGAILPEVVDSDTVASERADQTSVGRAQLVCNRDSVEDGVAGTGDPLHKTNCARPAPTTTERNSVNPVPNPLSALPRSRPCPAKYTVACGHREWDAQGIGITLRCRRWTCEGCRPHMMGEWARHLNRVFWMPPLAIWSGPADTLEMPRAAFQWRGPLDQCDRIAKYVARHDGQYARIAAPDDTALVVATVPFPRANRVTDFTTAEMVAAILAITPPAKGGDRRFRPITTSRGWKLPAPAKTGQWERLESFKNPEQSNAVLAAMGVSVRRAESRREWYEYSFPANWDKRHRKLAALWAAAETYPPGMIPGHPPPDPGPILAALCQ